MYHAAALKGLRKKLPEFEKTALVFFSFDYLKDKLHYGSVSLTAEMAQHEGWYIHVEFGVYWDRTVQRVWT